MYDYLGHEFNDELDGLALRFASRADSEFGHEFPEDRLPPIDPWDGNPTARLLEVAVDWFHGARGRPEKIAEVYERLVEELIDYGDDRLFDAERIYAAYPELRPLVTAAVTDPYRTY